MKIKVKDLKDYIRKAKVDKVINKVKILLPNSATESEKILMAQAVDIYKRKIKKKLGIK